MKAVLMTATGSVDGLLLSSIDEPEISSASEVKIKIKAASINPIDTKIRNNGSFYQHPLPIVLGCDGAGEIIAVGDEVTQYKVGDEVWFCHGGLGSEQGNYAEFTVIDERWIALKPATSTFVEAAAMPLILITAYNALFEKGNLQADETVLIQAGAGGVGHIAIQLAKIAGAKVITTVSSKEKAEFCLSLGADHCIIYSESNVVEEVSRLSSGHGVELALDTVGGDIFAQCVSATAYFGRVITLLDPSAQNLAPARIKNLLLGFELMLTPLLKQLNNARDKHITILKQGAEWVDQGKLKVTVSETLALSQVMYAHSEIEQGHTSGKKVIQL